jgi:hypothetical protein
MKRTSSVSYRENCGGTLRDLASGFRKNVSTLADVDLYDDLKERIFREDGSAKEKTKRIAA